MSQFWDGNDREALSAMQVNRPSGTCDSRFLLSRHFARPRAGRMTIAPPALERTRLGFALYGYY